MQEQGDNEGSSAHRASGQGENGHAGRAISPDLAAREDLVRWCGEHQLPVPPPEPALQSARR